MAGVEHVADLRVECIAHMSLYGIGHQRRQARCDLWHQKDRKHKERCHSGDGPNRDLGAAAVCGLPAMINGDRQTVDCAGKLWIADFEPRELRVSRPAEAEHAVRG